MAFEGLESKALRKVKIILLKRGICNVIKVSNLAPLIMFKMHLTHCNDLAKCISNLNVEHAN
jgi:hypothetical protein